MITRRLIQILPVFLLMAIAVQLSVTRTCYAEAFAYIPNSGDTNLNLSIIKVVVAPTAAAPESITVGHNPKGVAAGEDYIYVTNYDDATVSVVSVLYNKIVDTLDAGGSPLGIAVTSDEADIYVTNNTENTLSVIGTSSNVKTAISVGAGPLGVALSPLQDYIYITNNGDDSLSIITADTRKLFVTLQNHYYINYTSSSSDVAFDKPYGVAVSPDSNYIYVVNNGNNTVSILSAGVIYTKGADFTFSDYDPTSDTSGPYSLAAPIAVGTDPRGIVITPDQKYLYVTNYGEDTVSVIDLSTNAVVQTIPVGDGPYGISVTPSGDFVYVVNQLSNTVSVIFTNHGGTGAYTDYKVIATIPVGNSPVGFGKFIGGRPPRAPSSLVATKVNKTISLTWNNNADDELGFKIMRKQYVGGLYSLLATVDKDITEYTDESDLKNDSNYYYKVCAYNYAGDSVYSNESYATTGTSTSGCFIATAAYGSVMEPHVKILRNFRDRFLSTNVLGNSFLNLYYTYSPPIAHFIARHEAIRFIIRWSLLPLVGMSWLVLFIGPVSSALLTGSFLMLMLISIGLIKRRDASEKL
jgi:YVTN family beta-propeller protein